MNRNGFVAVALLLGFVQPFVAPARGLAQAGPDGAILERSAYAWPDTSALTEVQQRNLTNHYTSAEYAAALAAMDSRGDYEFENVWYASDGLRVRAYLYRPRKIAGKRLPVIIFNRGSGPMDDQGFILAPFFHRLAREGFIVLAPQYRGGAGGEGRDEIGGRDLHDVFTAITLARSLPDADTANVFMYGASRGGMMTFQAIRDGARINAAATFGAITDLGSYFETSWEKPEAMWPRWATERDAIVTRRSAIKWPDKLTVPLLLMHGGADPQVSPAQTLNLALALQRLKRPYELIIYAGDRHHLKTFQEDRDRRAIDWFRRHMR